MNIVPQPWITAEVVDFMRGYLESIENPKILEFGSGCSTAFFAQYTSNLVTIEHNPRWHEVVKKHIDENNLSVDLRLVQNDYYRECEKFPKDYFDFVLIDAQHRINCLRHARDIVKSGGVLMLDDSTFKEEYKVADEIMDDWQRFFINGPKKNPLNPDEPEKIAATTWWIKP